MIFFGRFIRKIVRMSSGMLAAVVAALIVGSSFLIYFLEPDTYQSPFNGLWWVMTTVTTVGYGDFYPHTVPGKVLGIFLYVFGISMISVVIGKVVDGLFIYKRKKEEGKLRYRGEGHFVIIDWSKHAELAINEIISSDPDVDIVLVAQLPKNPVEHERVYYVRGNPVKKDTLEQANLGQARAAFIFADELTDANREIRDAAFIDGKTLLTATAIERHFQHIRTVVEVRDREHIQSFEHVRVDEFILSSEMVPHLAVRSAFNPGASKIMSQLLSWGDGEELFEVRKQPHWRTYRDAYMELLAAGAALISDGERLDIIRRLDEPIPAGARLFVICDRETHAELM